MDVIRCIKTRHSCRSFNSKKIDENEINQILDAAIAAPSGKNGQPWRFSVISDSTTINEISKLSIYGHWMKDANKFICV